MKLLRVVDLDEKGSFPNTASTHNLYNTTIQTKIVIEPSLI
jgi:hypothetical protein